MSRMPLDVARPVLYAAPTGSKHAGCNQDQPMKPTAIVLPVAMQALLTLLVLVQLGRARSQSMRDSNQKLGDDDVRLGRNTWSDAAAKVANNYKSQFELPVLFYAVSTLLLITSGVDAVAVGLAWIFVLSRIAHTIIHTGPNIIKWRFGAFMIGVMALVVLWVKLALHSL